MFLLENPWGKKPYKILADYYKEQGKEKEAEAFEHLINEKFNNLHPDNKV